MKIKLVSPQQVSFKRAKALLVPFFSGEKIKTKDLQLNKEINKFSKITTSSQENELNLVFSERIKLIFLNLGEAKKWNQRKFLLAIRRTILFLKEHKLKEVTLPLDRIIPPHSDLNNLIRQIPENVLLADYDFVRYKERPKEGWPQIKLIEISWPNYQKYQKHFQQGLIIGNFVNFTRDLANIPGGDMTPQKLAEASFKAARKEKKIKIEVFNEIKMKKLRMGGILGVAQGSSQKPRLIILKYLGRTKDKKIDLTFVGKGVTFDTGGLDIKPFEAMKEFMYMDMSGGAAVLGATLAIAKMKIPLNIITLIPAVENMPSGQAFRPGDLLRAYNGRTIEVISTDAEGRIILADAISFAAKNYKPGLIIDIATLTGAVTVALGYRAIGLFTNLPKLEKLFSEFGENSGDYVWPLPCWEEYEEEIKGTFGDIANVGKYLKYGGATTAALFLKQFTENLPWVHLDIGSTLSSIENQGLAKGATGTGVRYLIELARNFSLVKGKL